MFHAHGVRRGDAVALLAPNCDELVTATLAAELAGIAAPVNGSLSQETVRELLRRSGARVLVAAGPELAPDVFTTARELAAAGDLDALLVLRPTAGASEPDPLPAVDGVHVDYLAQAAEGQPNDAFIGDLPSASEVAAVFHTGGTTGTPKLAAHTHTNEVSDAWMIAANGLLRNHEAVVFAALPLFHVNALVVTVLAPLFNGHHVVWAGPRGYRDPALYTHFWKLVQHYRVTAMSAVPTVYAALAGCRVDADISSLRLAFVGASPLPPAVREGFESTTGVAAGRGLRPHRGHLRQHAWLPRPLPSRCRRAAPALPADEGRAGRCRWAVGGPEARTGRHARDQGPDRVPRLRHRSRPGRTTP